MGNIQSCPILFLRDSQSSEISGSGSGGVYINRIADQPTTPSSHHQLTSRRKMLLENNTSQADTSELPAIIAAGAAESAAGQLAAIRDAASQLGLICHTTTGCTTIDQAVRAVSENRPSVIILDLGVDKDNDLIKITRFLSELAEKNWLVVGTTDSNTLETDEEFFAHWLTQGVGQIIQRSETTSYWINQLTQIIRGPVREKEKASYSKVLATALNNTRDIVQITDVNNKIVWQNSIAEKELGWSEDELKGSNIAHIQTTGQTTGLSKGQSPGDDHWLQTRIKEGKEWEGPINCKRKTGDYVVLQSKIIPVFTPNSSEIGQIIYLKQSAATQPSPPLNRHNTLNRSLRRPSVEITPFNAHDGLTRRRSSGKTNSVNMEAPINKVMNIILAAQENQPVYIAQALDKVVEILKASASSELFNPELETNKGRRGQDLVTKDLLGALLAKPGSDLQAINQKRRSSSEKISFYPRPSLPTLEVAPVQIVEVLSTAPDWSFDIFKLEEQTERRPLVWLGMSVLSRFSVLSTLRVEDQVLQNWLTLIESKYHSANSYHNSTHAADVLQASAYFLEKPRVQAVLDPVDQLILLIAAIIHDVDHPGRNSAFLCNSGSELAVLYNDTTVLENHHCALGYKLTISDPSVNIFKNLDAETYKSVRKGLIDTVLATDMSKHFVLVNKFTTSLQVALEDDCIEDFGVEIEDRSTISRMLIKCADVSNPARPLSLCKEWAIRIAEEYFSQTAEEKELGLPVVMPQFDRTTCSIPQSQIGFYDYFITSMFDAWDGFISCPELIRNIEQNYGYWKGALSEEEASGKRIKYTLRQREKSKEVDKQRFSKDLDKHRLTTVTETKGDSQPNSPRVGRTNGSLEIMPGAINNADVKRLSIQSLVQNDPAAEHDAVHMPPQKSTATTKVPRIGSSSKDNVHASTDNASSLTDNQGETDLHTLKKGDVRPLDIHKEIAAQPS